MVERDLLAVIGEELRLGIERIDVRNAAAHEQKDHRLGLGRKMRLLGGQRFPPASATDPLSAANSSLSRPGMSSDPATADRTNCRRVP